MSLSTMKRSIALVILATFVIVLSGMPAEATLSKVKVFDVNWTPSQPKPGSLASFTIYLKNDHSSQVSIRYVGIHFDWQPAGTYTYEDFSSNPKIINIGQNLVVSLSVYIPGNVNYTVHPYIIRVDYDADSSSHSEKSSQGTPASPHMP